KVPGALSELRGMRGQAAKSQSLKVSKEVVCTAFATPCARRRAITNVAPRSARGNREREEKRGREGGRSNKRPPLERPPSRPHCLPDARFPRAEPGATAVRRAFARHADREAYLCVS